MTLAIPPLDAEFTALLEDAIDNGKNARFVHQDWSDKLLPAVQGRLADIVEIALTQGEEFSVRPEGVNLPQSITGVHKRIVDHIRENFSEQPPFTLPRLAEVLLRPQSEGYSLGNNVGVLKYFNSLAKLILVSSGLHDFPPTTFLEPSQTRGMVESVRTSQAAVSIPLVEIPWLKQGENKADGQEKEKESDKQDIDVESKPETELGPVPTISPPAPTSSDESNIVKHEIPKSPRRRRDQETEALDTLDLGSNGGAKKARTEGNKSPDTPSKPVLSDEENDRMDLSSTTGEDSLTSPNPPINPSELLSNSPLQDKDSNMEDS